jgi:hypothetical protein
MHYHQNHMWCSRSNWDGKHFDTQYMISIDKYERRSAFPSYEILDEDWDNLLEFTAEYFDQGEYEQTLARLATLDAKLDKEREELFARSSATKYKIPSLKQEVLDWLNENVADDPKPYEQCAKGWCMGNEYYRANDSAQLSLFFYRRRDAMAFVKRWSVHKQPTTYLDYFKDIRKELIDGKLRRKQ